MAKKNPNLQRLASSYLFPEIEKRKQEHLKKHADAKLISLGIGDTTEPLPKEITLEMKRLAEDLSTRHGYKGYGPEQGMRELREKIAHVFYHGSISPEEIFISDGAKCDTGRLAHIFDKGLTVAVQDPAYPAYVDSSIISGLANNIIFLPCLQSNGFFPDLELAEHADLLFFCSPNNPTGSAATFDQLSALVAFAEKRGKLIIFDAAYSFFIKDNHLPKSIYEIPGAEFVAIEINSFSKLAGFTGLRLGWTVIPKALLFEDLSSVHHAWSRVATTFFNGASRLTQAGGLAALTPEGLRQIGKTRDYYLENALIIKETFESLGLQAFGGVNAPYVWVDFSPAESWEVFEMLLIHAGIVTTPGSGFGPSGEGFIRFSSFQDRARIIESMARITSCHVLSTTAG